MSDEKISIEIKDKVDVSISTKLKAIAKDARTADSAVKGLQNSLKSVSSSTGLVKLQNELLKTSISQQKLATEVQKTNAALSHASTAHTQAQTAVQNLAAASVRATTAQVQSKTASQKLATEHYRTAAASSQAAAASDRAALAALRLQNAQNRLAQSSSNAAREVLLFVRNAAAVVGLTASAGAVIGLAEAYTSLQNKLRPVTESQEQLNVLTSRIIDIANRTRQPVEEVAKAFTRFDNALIGLGKSQEEGLRMTETINKLLKIGGSSATEQASALLQLSQAFNSNVLAGDEFRSVSENMPKVVRKSIAEVLKVNEGALKQAASDGKITGAVLYEAFKRLEDFSDSKFKNLIPTVADSLTVLKNSAVKTFGEIDKSLGVTATLSKALLFLSNNMEAAALAVTVLGTALVAYFGPFLVAMLAKATAALVAFGAALLANPIGLIAVGIVAAVSALALFGDKIKTSADGVISLKDTIAAVWSFITEGFNSVSEFVRKYWEEAVNFISSKTESFGGAIQETFNKVLDFLKTFINTYIGVWVGAYNSVVNGWSLFPSAMKDIFAMALNNVLTITEYIANAALEGINKITSVANSGAEKLGFGKIFENDLSISLDKFKMEVTGAASELGNVVKNSFTDAFNTDFLGNASASIGKLLDNVQERARKIAEERRKTEGSSSDLRGNGPVTTQTIDQKAIKEAERRAHELDKVKRGLDEELISLQKLAPEYVVSNRLLEVENNLLDKKIKLSKPEREAIENKIKLIEKQKASNALKEINKELDDQSELLRKVGREQEILQQMQGYLNGLRSQGLTILEEERTALQDKLEKLQKEKAINEELNKIYSETTGKQQSLLDQQEALNQAYSQGIVNQEYYKNKTVELSLAMQNLRLQMQEGGFQDALTAGLGSLVSNYEGVLVQLQGSFANFFSSVQDGFANSIGRAIVYSENLGDAIHNVAQSALSELISSLVKVGLQYALNAAFSDSSAASQVAGQVAVGGAAVATQGAISAASTAALAAQAAASSATASVIATAWAPAASLVSLASFGANSAPAVAAITATTALTESIAAASRMPGFETGGYTGNGGTSDVAGVVHGKEFVFDAQSTQRIGVANLEAIRQGASYMSSSATVGKTQTLSPQVSVSIENYGSNKDFEVQQLSENEIRVIARDEAKNAIKKDVPNLVASSIKNPNSSVSKSLNQNTKTERRR